MKKEIDIETILRELYLVSGCRVSIHDSEYEEIVAYPQEKSPFCRLIQTSPAAFQACMMGDAEALSRVRVTEEPYIYRCRYGLYEAVAPLYHSGVLTGYLMLGQVADSAPRARKDIFTRALAEIDDGKFSEEEMRQAVWALLETDDERFRSFVGIMTICAEYITLTGRMNLPVRDLAHLVKKYINQNYAHHFALDDLCRNFRCSKSTLMNTFRAAYGTTINRYTTDVRLEHARRLLSETEMPIRQIAQDCGFSDQGYFTKVFEASAGCSPTAFRRRSVVVIHRTKSHG